jgi:hypothetical protein
MAGWRRCRICRQTFWPHPRAGKRQRVCSEKACQDERHRRDCADWRRRNPDYDRAERLRTKVRSKPEPKRPGPGRAVEQDPLQRLPWDAIQGVVGLEMRVVLEEYGQVSVAWTRDVVIAETSMAGRETAEVRDGGARDVVPVKTGEDSADTAKVRPPGQRDAVSRGARPP